jgi:hypothetical protein
VSSLDCTYQQVWPYLCHVWAVLTYKFGHICVKFGLYLQTSLDCTYLQVWTVLTYKFGHICVKFGLYLQTSLDCTYLQVWPYLCHVWTVLTNKFVHICVMFGLYLPPKLDTDMAKLVGKYSPNLTQICPNL